MQDVDSKTTDELVALITQVTKRAMDHLTDMTKASENGANYAVELAAHRMAVQLIVRENQGAAVAVEAILGLTLKAYDGSRGRS